MLKLKYVLLIIFCSFLLLSSCKDDEVSNPPPMVTINGDSLKLDTIKYSMRDEYHVFIDINDGNRPFIIHIDDYISNAVLYYYGLNTAVAPEPIPPIYTDNETFTLKSFKDPLEGNYNEVDMRVKVSDDDFKVGRAQLVLTVLGNQKPIPDLEIQTLEDDDIEFNININGCGSIDGDADYGGDIIKYKFTVTQEGVVNSYQYEGDQCVIPYVLPGFGTFTISLEVMDNEGALSEEIDTTFTIE